MARLPRIYRRLVATGMTTWGPWYFIDDAGSISRPVDLEKNAGLQKQLQKEANAAFDVYLFARRQDQDDFAFFYVGADGVIHDSVIASHLTFSRGPNHDTPATPVEQHQHQRDLEQWLQEVAVPDMMDWLAYDEEDPD